ncbi:nucleotidyltransferase family protein [Anaerostipes faecalis]|uniref:nucleotidyltransferase family protein n=1 Tax=Anaerostipes faecalis TaxID=2738446 RepID=UPI003F08B6FE
MKVSIIYLTSGNSRRFGSNKLLYPFLGKPMYQHLLDKLVRICSRHADWQIIVVSQHKEILRELEKWPLKTIYCPDSVKGISWTIKAGVSAADSSDACAFYVADQPYFTEKTAEEFLSYMERKESNLGCVSFQEDLGNPVWFSRKYFKELKELKGDQGGKKILMKYKHKVETYPVLNALELKDFDYLEEVHGTLEIIDENR